VSSAQALSEPGADTDKGSYKVLQAAISDGFSETQVRAGDKITYFDNNEYNYDTIALHIKRNIPCEVSQWEYAPLLSSPPRKRWSFYYTGTMSNNRIGRLCYEGVSSTLLHHLGGYSESRVRYFREKYRRGNL
jgi:hypothetical protein